MEGDRQFRASPGFDEALAEMERTGERFHEARLADRQEPSAGRTAASGRPSRAAANAAEDCLRRALDVAHAQGARLLELRAAVALARHCRARGRPADAQAPLRAAYAWFANRAPVAPEIAAAQRLLAAMEP